MSHQLTIKGQVTVPKEIREFLGLQSGRSAVDFVIEKDGSVSVRKALLKGARAATAEDPQQFCNRLLGFLAGDVVSPASSLHVRV